MDDGRPMTLPEIPFLSLLILILMAAGALITVAILQKMPAPIRYVAISKKPYTKDINEEKEEMKTSTYRRIYPGQFSRETGDVYYDKPKVEGDVDWKG